MFQRFFTSQQLSLFFQSAVVINIFGLFLDLIIYHFFPNNNALDILAANVSNVSIAMICAVIISQAALLFYENHQQFAQRYKIITLSIEICMSLFVLWILTIENDIEGEFIIFYSSLSVIDHSYKILCIVLSIFIVLVIDIYRNLHEPTVITNDSVPQIIRSSFFLVLKKHVLMLIFIFGIIHFKKIHKLSVALLNHSQSSLFFDLTLAEILVPLSWFTAICYYLYNLKKQSRS